MTLLELWAVVLTTGHKQNVSTDHMTALLLLLIYCNNVLPIVCGGYVFVFVSIFVLQSSELVALLLLSCRCLFNVNVLWVSLMVPWDGIQCLIVVFPGYTRLLFAIEWE